MFSKVTVKKMLNGLDGHLGEDDYSEPLEILINSAGNIFATFGLVVISFLQSLEIVLGQE